MNPTFDFERVAPSQMRYWAAAAQNALFAAVAGLVGLLLVHVYFGPSWGVGTPVGFTVEQLDSPRKQMQSLRAGKDIKLNGGRYIARVHGPFQDYVLIGDKNIREVTSGQLLTKQLAHGVAISVENRNVPLSIAFTVTGVSTISATTLDAGTLNMMETGTRSLAGLFLGGLALLSVYAALVGMVTRERLFGTFSFWLACTLSLGAVTAGYDLLWFKLGSVDPGVEGTLKATVCAAWALATPLLFDRIFGGSLGGGHWRKLITVPYWFGLVAVLLALVVPTSQFMPVFWAGSCIALTLATIALVRLVWVQRSLASVWYAAGWTLQLVAVGLELSGALGLMERLATPAFVPAGSLSAFLVSIAVADALRNERNGRLAALQEAARSERSLARMFRDSPAGIVQFDTAGLLVAANPAACRLLEIAPTAPLHLRTLLDKANSLNDSKAVGTAEDYRDDTPGSSLFALAPSTNAFLYEMRTLNGAIRYLRLEIHATESAQELAVSDITPQIEREQLASQLAHTDTLTQVGNRRALLALLQSFFDSNVPLDRCSILFTNVSRFRDINRFFGDAAGDAMLRELASRFQHSLPMARTFRLNADVLVAVLQDCDLLSLRSIAPAVHDAMTAYPVVYRDRSLPLTLQLAGQILEGYTNADQVVLSGIHLLDTIRTGPHSFAVFEPSSGVVQAWHEEQAYGVLIHAGIWRQHVELFAQPLVPLQIAGPVRFEALLRTKNLQGHMGSPAAFLAAAESCSAMPELDLWVVERTLEWIEALLVPPPYITCNLSGASFSDTRFVDTLMQTLKRHRRAARFLCLELTESVVVSDLERARSLFAELNRLGVIVALDDFGAGYTNFRYLMELPVQIVKLDGSMIGLLRTSDRHRHVVGAVVELAHRLNMQVVAEWVEDLPTVATLHQLGVDAAQGWLFAKAHPFDHWTTERQASTMAQTQALVRDAVTSL